MLFDANAQQNLTATQRLFAALRYWWWLALATLLLAGPGLFFAGRSLARCFESSVVIGFPVIGPSVDAASLQHHAIAEAIDQNPGIDDVLQQNGFEPLAIPQLGRWVRRGFLRTQLLFEPMSTTIPNSVALRIYAHERSPEAARTVAAGVGQSILDQVEDQMEAKLLAGAHRPSPDSPARQSDNQSASQFGSQPESQPDRAPATPSPDPAPPDPPPTETASAPPVSSAAPTNSPASTTPNPPQLRKVVTWKLAPESAEVALSRARLHAELITLEERRAKAQNDLGVLGSMPPVPIPRAPAMRPSNEAALKVQLNAANETLIELQRRYTSEHPNVIAAQQRVRDLQAGLEQAINKNTLIAKQEAAAQAGFNAAHARLAREAALQAQIVDLDAQMARDSAELDALGKARMRIPVVRYVPVLGPAASQTPDPSPAPAPAQPPVQIPPTVQAAPTSYTPAANPSAVPAIDPSPSPARRAELPQHRNLTATLPIAAMFVSQPVLIALSALLAVLLAFVVVTIAERTSGSVKDADVLETELPYSVQYVGEIPRMTR